MRITSIEEYVEYDFETIQSYVCDADFYNKKEDLLSVLRDFWTIDDMQKLFEAQKMK